MIKIERDELVKTGKLIYQVDMTEMMFDDIWEHKIKAFKYKLIMPGLYNLFHTDRRISGTHIG